MYIKKVHILIEQGLQTIGVFAYSDFLKEEVDLQINKKTIKLIDKHIEPVITAQNVKDKKFKLQAFLDKFQNLETKVTLNVTKQDDFYFVSLPDDYVHLTSDVSLVLSDCLPTAILTGSIISGHFYIVKGQKTIIYNGQNYTTGSIFKGVDSVTGFTFSGTGTLLINELRTKKVPNRLTEENLLYETLRNALEETCANSPVSTISGGQLNIFVDGFFIDKEFLTYLRKPREASIAFTTYLAADVLIVGKKYESIESTVTYNGVSYLPFVPFTVITGVLNFVGSSKVRLYQDGDVELSDSMTYVLIDEVIKELAILAEQSQQKIVNLVQKDGV